MDRRQREALDRYITGNYGEDQFKGIPVKHYIAIVEGSFNVGDSTEIANKEEALEQAKSALGFAGFLIVDIEEYEE